MTDAVGWRWGQYICAMMLAGILLILFFGFEETLFPRFLFSTLGTGGENQLIDSLAKRRYLQTLKPWVYYPQNKTTYMQYFRRPFFLFAFPNVVIVSIYDFCDKVLLYYTSGPVTDTVKAGFIYAFGCTAGIVSFNTISEILTEAPYEFSNTATGLMFLAALVGNFIGWGVGMASDPLLIYLARRNNGVKEPEMRLYMLAPCALFAGVGYFTYGWGAQAGAHWIAIGVGIAAMIAHQVGACSIATAYAMECFPQVRLARFVRFPRLGPQSMLIGYSDLG